MEREHHELRAQILRIMHRDPLRARRSYRYRPGKLFLSVPGYRVYFRESDTKPGTYESFEFVRVVKHPKSDLFWSTVKTMITMPIFIVLYVTNAIDFFFFTKRGRKKIFDKVVDAAKSFVDGRFLSKFLNVRPATLGILVLLLILVCFAGYTMYARNSAAQKALSREVVAAFLGISPDLVRVDENGMFTVRGYRRTAPDLHKEKLDVMFKPQQWLFANKTSVLIKRYNIGSDDQVYEPTFVAVDKKKNGVLRVNKNDEITFDSALQGNKVLFGAVLPPNEDKDYATDSARVNQIIGEHLAVEPKEGIAVKDIEGHRT